MMKMKNNDDRIIEMLVHVCNELANEGYNGTNAHIKQGNEILRMELNFWIEDYDGSNWHESEDDQNE